MTLVVDSNQAWLLPPVLPRTAGGVRVEALVLPPFVLAELILVDNPRPRRRLAAIRPRLGMQVLHVLEAVACLDDDGIAAFHPVAARDDEFVATLFRDLESPSDEASRWATACREESLAFAGRMRLAAQEVRSRIRQAARSQGGEDSPKFHSWAQVMASVGYGPSSYLGELIWNCISNGGSRRMVVETPARLFAAVARNEYLMNLFCTNVYYSVSYSQAWSHDLREHNFEPDPSRNDWTDVTIPLYARSGDCILTADRKLRGAVKMVTSDRVITRVVSDLNEEGTAEAG